MQPDNQTNQSMNPNPPTPLTPPTPPTPPIPPTPLTPPIPPTSPTQQQASLNQITQQPQTSVSTGMTSAPTSQPPVKKKSHIGLIIGIVVGLVCLVAIPFILITAFMVFGNVQVSSTSSSFMTAMTAGDVDKALSYTDGTSETKQFLQSMAPGMKATSFNKVDSTNKSGKHYFLYSLQGANNKMARTTLEKGDKGWQVIELVTGSNVALVGASSDQNNTTTSTEPVAQSSGSQCLVQSDFDNWYKDMYGKTATEYGFHFEDPERRYTANVHFEPDSLDTSSDNTGAVENMANLANDPLVKSKSFKIKLYGGVATSQADKDFADKRAEAVKNELIAKAVPADKIVIDPATSATDYESNPNDVSKRMNRVVVLTFDPTCSSSGQR